MFLNHSIYSKQFYFWSVSDWEREIRENYPLLRLVNEVETIQIMKSLDNMEKQIMIKGLLNRSLIQEQLEVVGENYTQDQQKYINYFLKESRRLRNIKISNLRPEDFNYHIKIDKKRFKKSIIGNLESILGNEIKNLEGGEFKFSTYFDKWKVNTYIDIGGRHHNLCYDHSIKLITGEKIDSHISLLGWLGIMGQTQWQYLSNEDLEPTAEALAKIVAHFINEVPKIFKRNVT